ncbi:MAG: hypothetical protein R3F65_22125 [bacterium]
MELRDRIADPAAEIERIAAWLDALDPEARVTETRALDPSSQRRLWRLARGRLIDLDHFVPPDRAPLQTVRHFGRNTLPAFKHFEKRFCRPPKAEDQSVLWGYNHGASAPLVGPGYFVVRDTGGDSRGEVVIDYTRIPPGKPAEWPALAVNERGLSRVVYAGMHDYMRKVSAHVSIGRAYKGGRETINHFVLCREP